MVADVVVVVVVVVAVVVVVVVAVVAADVVKNLRATEEREKVDFFMRLK